MQKKKMFRLPFTKHKESTLNTSIVPHPNQEEGTSYSLYTSIAKLPLHRLIECRATNNPSFLIIHGNPPLQELQLTWADINRAFAEEIQNEEYIMYMNLWLAIESLKADITNAETLIAALRDSYCDEFARMLNNILLQNEVFDYTNRLKYHKLLNRFEKMKGFLETKKELREQEFDAISDKHQDGKPEDAYAYFSSYLIAISNQVGYRIDDAISVLEYCQRVRDFNEYVKLSNQQNAGK